MVIRAYTAPGIRPGLAGAKVRVWGSGALTGVGGLRAFGVQSFQKSMGLAV